LHKMNNNPFYSIIVVCLNPGEKLKTTLDSILVQTFQNYEIIVKDGLSKDGAAEKYKAYGDERIKLYQEADTGIYDAMNQAVSKSKGRFIYFLNCGDVLWDEQVLFNLKSEIDKNGQAEIYYGNFFEAVTKQEVFSNPHLDRFACYRHLPCHQACFYQRELLSSHPFLTKYKVRADYEHFLWCLLDKKVKALYVPLLIVGYEGAGFSETKENRRRSAREHKEIVNKYMSKTEILRYRLIMFLTLAPLRTALARSKFTADFYNRIRKLIYHK